MSIGEKMILEILHSIVDSSPLITPSVAVNMLRKQMDTIENTLYSGDGEELSIEVAKLAVIAIKVIGQ